MYRPIGNLQTPSASSSRARPYQQLRHQQPQLLVESLQPAVGCGKVVVGDVVPDLGNVFARLAVSGRRGPPSTNTVQLRAGSRALSQGKRGKKMVRKRLTEPYCT